MRLRPDEQFDAGSRYQVVEHVVRPGWDGPGLIRSMSCWDGLEQATTLAASLEPRSRNAVAVRVLDRATNTWADTGDEAFR